MTEAGQIAETFPRSHYDTAKQYDIPNFADAWGLTAAELNLTVQALSRSRKLPTFTESDLIGYYFTQYGGSTEITTETLELLKESDSYMGDWCKFLIDALPDLISDETSDAVELGRIALTPGRDVALDDTLADFTDRVEIRGGAETGEYEGAKRFAEFLYPKEGVVLHYLGRSSLDLMKEHPRGYLKRLAPHGDEVLDRLTFHVDALSVTTDDEITTIYNALSYDEGYFSSLTEIVLVNTL